MKSTTKTNIKNVTLCTAIGCGIAYGLTKLLNTDTIKVLKNERKRSKNIRKHKTDVDKYETYADSCKAFACAAKRTKTKFSHALFDEKVFINTHVADEDMKEFLLDLISKAQFYLEVIETETKEFREAYINYWVEKCEAEREGFISKEAFDDVVDEEFDYDDGFFDDEEELSEELGEEPVGDDSDRKKAFGIPEEPETPATEPEDPTEEIEEK